MQNRESPAAFFGLREPVGGATTTNSSNVGGAVHDVHSVDNLGEQVAIRIVTLFAHVKYMRGCEVSAQRYS